MGIPLNNKSVIECPLHGDQIPAFIRKHLQYGEKIGFHTPDNPPDEDWLFKNAWCDKCHEVLLEEGEWNDRSEGFAEIMTICEGCFKEIRNRNKN
jgi:hypothetical protein